MATGRHEKISDLTPNLKAIARRIRQIRGFDLTQSAFAKILGISGKDCRLDSDRGVSCP
jgi:DNA-binding transcriptional regulator YiaG